MCAAVLGLCGGRAAAYVVYDDGGTHLINGPSYPVEVYDSASGATTTLTIVHPAHIDTWLSVPSVLASASHGGEAVVNLHGGTLRGILDAVDNSRVTVSGGTLLGGMRARDMCCVDISGGSFGHKSNRVSLFAGGTSGTAVVAISDGTFAGGLVVQDWARVEITGGSFGADLGDNSLAVNGTSGTAVVDVAGATFARGLRARNNSRVTVSGSSFGADMTALSVLAGGGPGYAVVDIVSGTFSKTLVALGGAHVSVADGSFGLDDDGNSVVASSASSRTAVVDISGGTFAGGVWAYSQGRVRLDGGSFGTSGNDFPASVRARAASGAAVVQVFGGTFSSGCRAGQNGTIHVYGQGLGYVHGTNLLTGTLADGTPLSVEAHTTDNGHITLPEIAQLTTRPPGFSLPKTDGTGPFWLPAHIVPPPEGCPLGAVPVPMQGGSLGMISLNGKRIDAGGASAIVQRTSEAMNPGRGTYQDTIPIELVALQLRSAQPLDLRPLGGTGTDHLFLTLQADRGLHLLDPTTGLDSTGEMTLDFAMRTFDSSLDVFYDVRAGTPDGEILFSGNDTLVATQVPWSPDLPEDWFAMNIEGGFFAGVIGGSLVGFDQAGEFLQLRTTTVLIPEPATLALLAAGAVGLLRRRKRR